ncbi:MAG: RNA polymerase sigma factor RpoD/SigA [Candidatus Omnitrophota bacterium]|nr:RNA polymerase sigma factor RpoD/SigA [Candidatus Omnitrophota bacterium]
MEAIKAYLERIKNIPVLTQPEEESIVKKAKRGNKEARRKMITSNLKLVVNIAKHYSRYGLPLMDLIAEGNIGLMRAINKFNTRRGYRFSTYSAWWIRQAITRALIDQGKTIRIPVYMSEVISKFQKSKEQLRQKLNREPNRKEIAKKLKVPVNKIGEIEMWIQKKSSLEAPVGDDGESQLGDFIEGKDYADTSKEIEKIFEKERLTHLLDSVTERERLVLNLRFGIADGKPHILADVAKILNVSRERIRQIEKEALRKVKKYAIEEQKKDLEI